MTSSVRSAGRRARDHCRIMAGIFWIACISAPWRDLPKGFGKWLSVYRQFQAERPNALWLSDFTNVATWAGFIYVAFVIDAFVQRIVGRRVSSFMETGFVLDALEQSLYVRRPVENDGLIRHSDRGVQYA